MRLLGFRRETLERAAGIRSPVLSSQEKALQKELLAYDAVNREAKVLWKESCKCRAQSIPFIGTHRLEQLSEDREKLAAHLKTHWLLCRHLLNHPESSQTFLKTDIFKRAENHERRIALEKHFMEEKSGSKSLGTEKKSQSLERDQ